MGIEKNIILGSVMVGGGMVIYLKTPQQKTELPTDPEQMRVFAVNHCDDILARMYPGIPITQKTYEGCVNRMVSELASPFDRFLYDHNEEILGSILIGGGIILAALPVIIRGRARFGLR